MINSLTTQDEVNMFYISSLAIRDWIIALMHCRWTGT